MDDEERPIKCRKILLELEKRAPDPIHYKELAYLCNISTFELAYQIKSHPMYFNNVERIETDRYTKYRLNLNLKRQEYEEKAPELTILDKITLFFQIRKG